MGGKAEKQKDGFQSRIKKKKNDENGRTDLQKYAREIFVPSLAPRRARLVPFRPFPALRARLDPQGVQIFTFLLIMKTEHTVTFMTEASVTLLGSVFRVSASGSRGSDRLSRYQNNQSYKSPSKNTLLLFPFQKWE